MRDSSNSPPEQRRKKQVTIGPKHWCLRLLSRECIRLILIAFGVRSSRCDKDIPWRERTNHDDVCPAVSVFCPNGCGVELLRGELAHHTSNQCSRRPRQCHKCTNLVLYDDREAHRESCPAEQVPCPSQCGAILQRRHIKSHLEKDCPQRMINCRQCGAEIVCCKQHQHSAQECPRFEIECASEISCGCFIPRCEMATHVKNHCENRVAPCMLCGEEVLWRNMENHRKEVCPEEVVSCPHAVLSGCVVRLKRKDMPAHAKDATIHLDKAFMQIRKLHHEVSTMSQRILALERANRAGGAELPAAAAALEGSSGLQALEPGGKNAADYVTPKARPGRVLHVPETEGVISQIMD